MRAAPALVLATSLTAVAACHPRHIGAFGMASRPVTVVDRLVCPGSVGDLQRSGEASDGRSCAYSGPRDEAVQLSLTPLDGLSAQARLATLDATLKSELPATASTPHGEGVYVGADKGASTAHIDLPGFHLNASNDKANIRLPGVSIDADGDDAKVTTAAGGLGGTQVQAHRGGAEIRTGGVNANGVQLTYLLASNTPGPGGYRVVGYRAKGPLHGPLVVATFRAKGENHHGDELDNKGLEDLLALNAHG